MEGLDTGLRIGIRNSCNLDNRITIIFVEVPNLKFLTGDIIEIRDGTIEGSSLGKKNETGCNNRYN
jgi:hypothetical protein